MAALGNALDHGFLLVCLLSATLRLRPGWPERQCRAPTANAARHCLISMDWSPLLRIWLYVTGKLLALEGFLHSLTQPRDVGGEVVLCDVHGSMERVWPNGRMCFECGHRHLGPR